MPDIDPNSIESINSIADLYPEYRQKSKMPTFALTYFGTYLTLMNNLGLTEEEAKSIETQYHSLYSKSDIWADMKLRQAQIDGYVTTGFGLKVRTPVMKSCGVYYKENRVASAESRTAGNALGQGWGVLNDRAMLEVMQEVDRLGLNQDILPCGAIHDCCYYLVRNKPELISILNTLCVNASKWQDHPVIAHPDVGLEGNLDLFIPNWSKPITLPDEINSTELTKLLEEQCMNQK